MDRYSGTYAGKQVARELTLESLRLLGGDKNFNNGNHVSLAGWEAGDLNEVLKKNSFIKPSRLHVAEKNYSRFLEAKNHIPSRFHNCLYYGDVTNMIQERSLDKNVSVCVADSCGTAGKNTLNFLDQLLPSVKKTGVMAINITYGRDGLSYIRDKYRHSLQYDYQHWKPLATADILTRMLHERGYNIYFSVAIAYSNNGASIHDSSFFKNIGAPMLTLIGRWACTPAFEGDSMSMPTYFARLGRGGNIDYVKSINYGNAAFRAHLPKKFKEYWNQYL